MGVIAGTIASFLVVFVAYCALAVVEGRLRGREEPNLELGMAGVFAAVGAVLFPFLGWTSTLGLLGVFVAWTLGGAWLDRDRAALDAGFAEETRGTAASEVTRLAPPRTYLEPETALELLGSLASKEVQRRYMVGGTREAYLLPGELLNDADSFLNHPRLGSTASLRSARELARLLEESVAQLPLDDASVSNEVLVEHEPHWAALRNAARAVLAEMGADLVAWESECLASDGA